MTPLLWFFGERAAGCVFRGASVVRVSIFVRGELLASVDEPRPADLDVVWRWLCAATTPAGG